MAGKLSSFMSGAQLVIRIGSVQLAYCQGISFSDNMTNVPVGGIGSYSFHAIEPVQYIGQGSLVITRYSTKLFDAAKKLSSANDKALPANLQGSGQSPNRDGNSLLDGVQFNPSVLLLSATVDIDVYSRADDQKTASVLVYKLEDCRFTNYAFSFTPGTIVQENLTFICRGVIDQTIQQDQYKLLDTTTV